MSNIDQLIDGIVEKRINDMIELAVQRKLEALIGAEPAKPVVHADPDPATTPPLEPTVRHGTQSWPRGTIVHVNPTSMGPPSNTDLGRVWRAIKAHMPPPDEMERGKLAVEMELVLNKSRGTLSALVSRLLQQHHLVASRREFKKA